MKPYYLFIRSIKTMAANLSLLLLSLLVLTGCGTTDTPSSTRNASANGMTAVPTSGRAIVEVTPASILANTTVSNEKAKLSPSASLATTTSITSAITNSTPATQKATTASVESGSFVDLTSIKGLKEFKLSPELTATLARQMPSVKDLMIRFYGSDQTAEEVAGALDQTLTSNGYAFALPGTAKPQKQGGVVVSLYVKPGVPDLMLSANEVLPDPDELTQQLNLAGLSKGIIKPFVEQVKSQKTIILVLAAPNMLNTMFNSVSKVGGSNIPPPTTAAVPSSASVSAVSPAPVPISTP